MATIRLRRLIDNVAINYFRTSYEELRKVTWPSRETTIRYAITTIILCAALAAYFGLLDYALSQGLKALISVTS
ncbi:TPA: preprotein translocase subunit SecE [Candidatus Uhrbacteria bacterium]|nr:preprotein translocase subunit SecE [Candidatus Uhrbacteria bacterium]